MLNLHPCTGSADMDVRRKSNSRDDLEMDAMSFGSNYHQSSQSRKMSIGIVTDSVANCRIQKVKQSSSKGTSAAMNNTQKEIAQQTSPWISTKTLHHEPTLTPAELPSIIKGLSHMCKVDSAVCSFKIQTRTLQSEQVKEYAATERVAKFASMEDTTEKQVKGKTENAGSETLRLKLREILGTVTSQSKQCPNSPLLAQDANVSHKGSGYHVGEPAQNSDTIESDTLSYTIRKPMTRSLARKRVPAKFPSHNRKRASAYKEDPLEKNVFLSKDQWSKTLRDARTDGPVMVYGRRGKRKSDHIEEPKICENNAREDEVASNSHKRVPIPDKFVHSGTAAGNGSSLFQETNAEMVQPNAGKVESPVAKMTEHLRDLQEHIDQQGNIADKYKSKAFDSESDNQSLTFSVKTSSRKSFPGFAPRSDLGQLHGDVHEPITPEAEGICKVKSFDGLKRDYTFNGPGLFQEKKTEILQPNAGKLVSPAVEMTEQLRNLQEHIYQQENLADKSKRKALSSESDKQSLTFSVKTSSRKSFPGFAPRSNLRQLNGDGHEPIASKTESICKVKSFDGLKRDYKSNGPDESSDDAGKLESSPFPKSRRTMEEDTQKPSSMESDSGGSEGSSNIQGGMPTTLSPEFGNTAEQEAPQSRKRLFNKGIDCRKFEMHLEQSEEDPLTSAITLFALSLEKVRSKMKSVTTQRSAEILKSVAEKIHMQLQKAESQIQADMGKITSINKSKRKHVEEVLQEKQQHLDAIYERFKEEVNRHVQDCRSTLESLEAHEVEIKSTVEKRKASNRKLLLGAEEEIESQLDYAERSISAVHHVAREKMRQLKMVVAECLKEGILG